MKRLLVVLIVAAAAVDVVVGVAAPTAEPAPARIAPAVSVTGVRIGNLTSEEARSRLRASFERSLAFVYGDRRWYVKPARLGARAAIDSAVARALTARRGERLLLDVEASAPEIRRYVRRLDRQFSVPAQDAELVGLANLSPSFSEATPGVAVRQRAVARSIVASLRWGSRRPIRVVTKPVEPAVTANTFGPVVVIRRKSNRLYLYDGTRLSREFGVATGQAKYPTPLGRFSVVDMQRNPWWRPPDSDWAKGLKPIPPGPGNPLGTRWMGISSPGVGMHGTPDAASIGYSASHGCIRLKIPDAEWLFERVEIGTPVFIVDA